MQYVLPVQEILDDRHPLLYSTADQYFPYPAGSVGLPAPKVLHSPFPLRVIGLRANLEGSPSAKKLHQAELPDVILGQSGGAFLHLPLLAIDHLVLKSGLNFDGLSRQGRW